MIDLRLIGLGRAIALAALVLAALPIASAAHQRHRPVPAAASAESLGLARDSAATPPEKPAADSAAGVIAVVVEAKEERFRMPPLRELLTEHLHNKIVHFPIALSVVAVVLLMLARSRPEVGFSARVLIGIAAVLAIGAYFTGRMQEEAFEGEPKEWLVHVHERWGTAASIALVGWGLLAFVKRSRGWLLGFGVAAAIAVAVTAFYGGLVAHGH